MNMNNLISNLILFLLLQKKNNGNFDFEVRHRPGTQKAFFFPFIALEVKK